MHEILKDTKMVVFDVMGVIVKNPSLVREGLYPIYKEKYSYQYIKGLYDEIRSNLDGDASLWEGLGEKDHAAAREVFLDEFDLDEGFSDLTKILKENNVRMGILSNMPKEWGSYFVKKFNLDEEFEPKLFSGGVGVRKPDYGKYVEFIKRTDINSSQMLFIDDKIKNLERASLFGIRTVLFERSAPKKLKYEPDFVIRSFKDLV